MDNLLIIIGSIMVIVGIAGSILTVLPGPLLSFGGLLLLQFTSAPPFKSGFMVAWAIVILAVTMLDFYFPVWQKKMIGGSKPGIYGASFGLIAGIFIFPPFGMVFGPLAGALIGEILGGNTKNHAIKTSLSSFLGSISGTTMKLCVTITLAYYFIASIFQD
jgi:uncharacterized protein